MKSELFLGSRFAEPFQLPVTHGAATITHTGARTGITGKRRFLCQRRIWRRMREGKSLANFFLGPVVVNRFADEPLRVTRETM